MLGPHGGLSGCPLSSDRRDAALLRGTPSRTLPNIPSRPEHSPAPPTTRKGVNLPELPIRRSWSLKPPLLAKITKVILKTFV